MIKRGAELALLLIAAAALTACGGNAAPPGKDATKAASVAVISGKSNRGASLDAMLKEPKVGDFFAIDGNKFLAEFDPSTTAEEQSEPAFGILHVTGVTGATVRVDMFSELFDKAVDLDDAMANGTLIDVKRYDNDPDTLMRNRITGWGTKGIASAGLRR